MNDIKKEDKKIIKIELSGKQKNLIKSYYEIYVLNYLNNQELEWRKNFNTSKNFFDDLINNDQNIDPIEEKFKFFKKDILKLLTTIRVLSSFQHYAPLKSILEKEETFFDLEKFNKILYRLKKNKNIFENFLSSILELRNIKHIGTQIVSQIGCYFDPEQYPLISDRQWKIVREVFNIDDFNDNIELPMISSDLLEKNKEFLYKIYTFIEIKKYIQNNLDKTKSFDFFELNKFLWTISQNKTDFENLISREKTNYWIFQSNPKKYDIEKAIKELKEDTFSVNQYETKIKKGDKALFWISGDEAGIIGYGDILSNPEMLGQSVESETFIIDEELKEKKLRVRVSYNPIEPKLLKNDLITKYPEIFTKELSIIKLPQGTNFPIDEKVWNFIEENFIRNYFIFVFKEDTYEDESKLGKVYEFPDPDKGGYKFKGKTVGSWGLIINNVRIHDKVIWTISGNSRRVDKKTFWGYGEIYEVDHSQKLWKLKSFEFSNKLNTDEIINQLSEEYLKLYKQSSGIINIGFYGTIQIDEFQYNFILNKCKDLNIKTKQKESEEKGTVEIEGQESLQELEVSEEEKKEDTYKFSIKRKLKNDYFDIDEIKKVKNLLLENKQIIFYGPPGTGKTYFAQILAQEIANEYEIVQFHPSYSYEDFVECIEAIPSSDGKHINYQPKSRLFRNLCNITSNFSEDKKVVLIIDEINRGDIARIFGELIFGLESSYRGIEIKTPLSEKLGNLKVPSNLLIIGTMNSVDRSIAIVDYALRRRFLFYLMMPNEKILKKWLNSPDKGLSDEFKQLVETFFKNINEKIKNDEKLGEHYQIGHAYFFVNNEEQLKNRWEYSIKPLLEEYLNFNNKYLSDYEYEKFIPH